MDADAPSRHAVGRRERRVALLRVGDVAAIGLVPQHIGVSVGGSLGLVGLLLAAIGVYGVTAFAVSRRTREIGIRMALGADQRRVLRLVLRQGFILSGIGIASGVAVASAGATLLESLLFGIRGLDPLTFASACLILALVSRSELHSSPTSGASRSCCGTAERIAKSTRRSNGLNMYQIDGNDNNDDTVGALWGDIRLREGCDAELSSC